MLRLWDLRLRGRCVRQLHDHGGAVMSVAVDAMSTTAFSACEDGALRFWDLASGRCRAYLPGQGGLEACVLMDAAGTTAVSLTDGAHIRVWDVNAAAATSRHSCRASTTRLLSLSAAQDLSSLVLTSRDASGVARIDMWA
mmetsp:Transcript_20585/g.61366  ORF Transcript_20585/g.61366 Transcript_20585/m.61366 type:complete len:140 (-) Transcript_20585:1199-1618(-)